MHKGLQYPFADDLWAVSSQFWPGFIPRVMRVIFGAVNPFPWDAFAGMTANSVARVTSVNRELVFWEIAQPNPLITLRVTMAVALAPVKATVYTVSWGPLATPAFAVGYSDPTAAPTYGVQCFNWPNGVATPPNLAYVAPEDRKSVV